MTYYSTCRQLSFGRRNLGRPTTELEASTEGGPERSDGPGAKPGGGRRSRSVGARSYAHLFPRKTHDDEETYLKGVRARLSDARGAYKTFLGLVEKLKDGSVRRKRSFDFEEVFGRLVTLLGRDPDLVQGLRHVLPPCYLIQVQKDAIIVKEMPHSGDPLMFRSLPSGSRSRKSP